MNKKGNKANKKSEEPGTWVDQYGDLLYGYAVARVSDPSVAEEVVQDTFLAAIQSYENFEGKSTVRTWLVAILKNKIVDYFRKSSREIPLENMDSWLRSEDPFFDEKGAWREKPQKWAADPMSLFEKKEFWEVISQCLSELPPRLSRALMLREMDGLRCDEISEILNVSRSNCWVMLYRARMSMRQCLEMNWFSV